MRFAIPTRRRLAWTAAGLLAAAALASSCSLDAAVSTDDDGRVIGIDALQLHSTALDLALAVILDDTETVFELRWRSLPGESRFPI